MAGMNFNIGSYVPPGMPSYGTGLGNMQRPKTPNEIANEQAQANVGGTQQDTANNAPTVNSEFSGRQPVRQPAYEDQAMAALQGLQASNLQEGQFGQQSKAQAAGHAQEKAMFDARVAANNARMAAIWGKIGGLPVLDAGGGMAGLPDGQEQAARDAAFGREKDRIGQMGRGAVNSLTNLMSERGTSGGGYEQAGLADIVGGTQGQLGDVAREQTIQDVGRAAQVGDRNYAGNLQRRGQDMNYKQAMAALMSQGGSY